jgi:NAD(P)-dependent dehydrogenase (short-subunit alcohol dehydrogenase family)
MNFENTVAVVTGANRGLGLKFAEQLLARGAKVYAAARQPDSLNLSGAIPLKIDLNDNDSIEQAAATAHDATFVINNAGISTNTLLTTGSADAIRLEMDTNYFGPLAVTRAFAPVIERNGGGAFLNVLSILSWLHLPDFGAYAASKASAWAMTNAVRQELAPKGIHVAGLFVAFMDTDMASDVDPSDKTDPALVAKAALDGVAAGAAEIIADDKSRWAKGNLSAPL